MSDDQAEKLIDSIDVAASLSCEGFKSGTPEMWACYNGKNIAVDAAVKSFRKEGFRIQDTSPFLSGRKPKKGQR